MKVSSRDIIEVVFELPDGDLKIHPAIVISGENYMQAEGAVYAVMVSTKDYNPEFSILLSDDIITNSFSKKSFAKCHLIQSFSMDEILTKRGQVTIKGFIEIKKKVIEAIFE